MFLSGSFPASMASLPLRVFRGVAPFTDTTWTELGSSGDLTLGELNWFERRLMSQTEEDLLALVHWLDEHATLPLRVHIRPRTAKLVDQTIGVSPAGPTGLAMRRMLDDPLVQVLQSQQMPPREIDQLLEYWCKRYRPVDDTSASLLDELERHLWKNPRHRGMLSERYGFRQRAPRTFAEMAEAHGFTPQRGRQLVARAWEPLHALREPLPLLHQAYRLLLEAGEPLPLQEWHRSLPRATSPTHWWELRVVRRMHDWTGMVPVAWVEHEGLEWAAPSAPDLKARLERIASQCKAATRRFALPPSLAPIAPPDHALAVRYLRAHRTRFARSPGGWWVRRPGDGTDNGARAPRRLLTALGPLAVDELRGGLRRIQIAVDDDPRRRMTLPTVEQLPSVLRTAGFDVDEHGMVGLGTRQPGPEPGTRSAAIIRALRGVDHELTWTEMQQRCAAEGITRNQMSQLAGRSPMLRRLGRGRYTLRGSGIAVGVEEDWSPPDAPPDALIEDQCRESGTVVLGWRVDPTHAFARHPLNIFRPRDGQYFIVIGTRRWRVWVERPWIRGLHRLEARLRRLGVRQMRVKFTPGSTELIPLKADPWGPYTPPREWPGRDRVQEL